MTKLFGTDGMRGKAGEFPLDYDSVYALGSTLVYLLKKEGLPPQVLIGRDTRESGIWLEKALFQGIWDHSGSPASAGIIPTSAISFLTRKYSYSAGIVISASHNPYSDNGIKIFSSQGMKISDDWENRLEKGILKSEKNNTRKDIPITTEAAFPRDYSDFLKSCFAGTLSPGKMKVVLDCAHGASSAFAPQIFSDLGVEVIAINNTPDGKNINVACGSLHPQGLAAKVMETGADMGIAYDGDADRALWVDEKGGTLNGDHTLYVLSRYMQEKGTLKSGTVVATIMSNLGLEVALSKRKIHLFRAPVGDKYVLENMLQTGGNLGGEQSGHTILLDDCPTGDGILTSIKMLEAMVVTGSSFSEIVAEYEEYPQVLENVRVARKEDFSQHPEIHKIMKDVENQLGESGRLNVRYSGTEPLARVMIEGEDQSQIESQARRIASVISKYLG